MARILLIEDDELLMKTTASMLTRGGHEVLAFQSLKTATTTLFESTPDNSAPDTESFDFLLLDLSTADFLPPEKLLDWVNLLFPKRLTHSHPRVGLISGSFDLEKIAAQFKADFFVEKPFHPNELRKKLAQFGSTIA